MRGAIIKGAKELYLIVVQKTTKERVALARPIAHKPTNTIKTGSRTMITKANVIREVFFNPLYPCSEVGLPLWTWLLKD